MGHGAVTGEPVTGVPVGANVLRAIVFDMDGTLYQDDCLGEEVHQSACRYVASLQGISPQEAARLLQEARSCLPGSGGTLSRAVVSLGGELKELHRRFNQEVHPEELLRPDPLVQELLGKLAGRFELHLYTNNNRALSGRIMAQLGIGVFFRRVFTIEDTWQPKPDLTTLQGILEAIGKKPGETLFVGDRYEVDLELPASLGCAVHEARNTEELLSLARLVE